MMNEPQFEEIKVSGFAAECFKSCLEFIKETNQFDHAKQVPERVLGIDLFNFITRSAPQLHPDDLKGLVRTATILMLKDKDFEIVGFEEFIANNDKKIPKC